MNPKCIGRHVQRTAFSLFEILIVLCLMAFFACTALPTLAVWLDGQQLEQASEMFVVTLNNEISECGREGMARTVEIERNGNRFRILHKSEERSTADPAWAQLPGGFIFRIPDGSWQSSTAEPVLRIEIRSDGRCSGGLILICSARQSRTIELDSVSGLARVIRGT